MRKFNEVFDGKDFLWGSGTAAYQCEGAWNLDGKGIGEWDFFSHNSPLNINDKNGDVSSDFYHRYREDIDLMAQGSQNTYRFSISWSRIMPLGTGEVNKQGIEFYNEVIDYCLEKGVEPNVTLFHYDLPLELAKKGGWLNQDLIKYFNDYAKVCFEAFGDRVKLWSTINEPRYYSYCTNMVGNYPPNRKMDLQSYFQFQYHLMLASAKAIASFREMNIDGIIGVVHDNGSVEVDPESKNKKEVYDVADFFYNRMILEPALNGSLPKEIDEMEEKLKFKLYPYEDAEEIFKNGVGDYLGLNLYNRQYVKNWTSGETEIYHNNKGIRSESLEGMRLKPYFESSFDKEVRRNLWGREVNPRVMYTSLKELRDKYNNPMIMITENGHGIYENPDNKGYVEDEERIEIFSEFIDYMLKAKEEGVNVVGYYHWSTMDLYSWINGYEKRYGLVRIDFEDNQRRIPKKSYYWFKDRIDKYYESIR